MKLKVHRNRRCFFSRTVVNVWNKLPASVVEDSFVNIFKKRLNNWISDVGYASCPLHLQATSYKKMDGKRPITIGLTLASMFSKLLSIQCFTIINKLPTKKRRSKPVFMCWPTDACSVSLAIIRLSALLQTTKQYKQKMKQLNLTEPN